MVRSSLYKRGYGFRLHRRDLPGTPDIVLKKYGVVIFVNGCFWHQHGCDKTSMPKTRKKFWKEKFETNKERDRRNKSLLEGMGWKVVVVWECDINANVENEIDRIVSILKKRSKIKLRIKNEKKKEKRVKSSESKARKSRKRKGKSRTRKRKGAHRN
jgi:DNA mismatch endonuclease (patch repair protein)